MSDFTVVIKKGDVSKQYLVSERTARKIEDVCTRVNGNQANEEIREALAKSKVKHWELAEKIGVTASWLSVRLRKELPEVEKQKLLSLIDEIREERR